LPSITDEEFGTITIRRSSRASHIRIRVAPNGKLRASLPLYAPLFLVKRLVKNSRGELRELLSNHQKDLTFSDGMTVGKSHVLLIRHRNVSKPTARRHGQQIVATLPPGDDPNTAPASHLIHDVVLEALRLEAKSHLPKRLAYLANKYGFGYEKVRFSHAGSRWGSCSSNGTISLNIALMKLPFELIDYVLVHELSHTVEMNHSDNFWRLVEQGDPQYKIHRRLLKAENPSI